MLLIDKIFICILKICRWFEGGYVKKMKFKICINICFLFFVIIILFVNFLNFFYNFLFLRLILSCCFVGFFFLLFIVILLFMVFRRWLIFNWVDFILFFFCVFLFVFILDFMENGWKLYLVVEFSIGGIFVCFIIFWFKFFNM